MLLKLATASDSSHCLVNLLSILWLISSFTSYVLILLFKLSMYLSYYCQWINELYISLFCSCQCVLCLFNKNYLNFVDGNKVMEWWDSFSHDDLRGKVILCYANLLSSFELRHLIHCWQVTLATSGLLVTWHHSVLS